MPLPILLFATKYRKLAKLDDELLVISHVKGVPRGQLRYSSSSHAQ